MSMLSSTTPTRTSAVQDLYWQLAKTAAGLESYSGNRAGDFAQKDITQKAVERFASSVFSHCVQFLQDAMLIKPNTLGDLNNINSTIGMASFNTENNLTAMPMSSLDALMNSCRIPQDSIDSTKRSVLLLLSRFRHAAESGESNALMKQHFMVERAPFAGQLSTESIYAPSLQNLFNTPNSIPSQESFGANSDNVISDIRAALTITMLQPHRGLLNRVMHRRVTPVPYVEYVVPYSEIYDMIKSNDPDGKVRNGEHIEPLIELYAEPRAVSNQLKLIVPRKANDKDNSLYSDGFINFDREVNLFDLALDPTQLGGSHINYTDLVSEQVKLDSVLIKVSKKNGSEAEIHQIKMYGGVTSNQLNMIQGTVDSGLRGCVCNKIIKLGKDAIDMHGNKTKLLAKCTEIDYIKVTIRVAPEINLKYSTTQAMGNVMFEKWNRNGAEVSSEVTAIAEDLAIELVAYSMDARYSEENLRKSNLAIRTHRRTFAFEIPLGRNTLIDYAYNEEQPENVLGQVAEITSIGQDHRAIDIVVREMMHVFDVNNLENNDPNLRGRLDKIGFQFVAGQIVKPTVYLNTIDLANVDNVRSGDIRGDIREYVEWELQNLISLLYQNSYYKHQLPVGTKPVFKVMTSSVILENIFSVPHYHNHLNSENTADGSTVEYRRVLDNGTILDCVTTTFNYMRDKIIIIPYIENSPESELNWGHNWDCGTFIGNYNPQIDNGVNKRIFSNTRAIPIPTNPMGLYIDVVNISKIIDLTQTLGKTISKLPQPAEAMLHI